MNTRAKWGGRQYLLALLDLCLGPLGYLFVFYVRFHGLPPANFRAFELMAAFVAILGVGMNSLYGLYEEGGSTAETLALSSSATFLMMLLTMALSFFLRAFALPRSVILLAWPVQALLFTAVRVLLGGAQRKAAAKPQAARTIEAEAVLRETAAGRDVLIEPDLTTLLLSTARIVRRSDGVALALPGHQVQPHERVLRRTMDILFSLLGLAALLVLIIPVGLLVVLESGFPLFYKQQRVGRGERIFTIHKIRTMRCDAERDTGAVLALADDARVTRIGRFLRATRLDELPQVWNVLRGEMSIVGPRPERPELHRRYKETVAGYEMRTLVRPGMTGLAQVYGTYAMEPAMKLQYDLLYILRHSLGLDLFIILRTISVLLQPAKARGLAERPDTKIHAAR